MKLLLDTSILAELRDPQKSRPLKTTLSSYDDEILFLSVITIGEIAKSISLLSDTRKKSELTTWLTGLEHQFSDRILPIIPEIAFMWGELMARTKGDETTVSGYNGLIAATALFHGLHLMTRRAHLFKSTGALIIEP